jgi:hypothetical protein
MIGTFRPQTTARQLVELYEAWGRPDTVAGWRKKLGASKK